MVVAEAACVARLPHSSLLLRVFFSMFRIGTREPASRPTAPRPEDGMLAISDDRVASAAAVSTALVAAAFVLAVANACNCSRSPSNHGASGSSD